jgi:hypothetical protein
MATVELTNEESIFGGPYFTDDDGDLLIRVTIDEREYLVSVVYAEVFRRDEVFDLTPVGDGATFKVTI